MCVCVCVFVCHCVCVGVYGCFRCEVRICVVGSVGGGVGGVCSV